MELTDDLKNMLVRDIECRMIDQTQSYLRDLGITPFVKGTVINKSLKESNGDPVKFLIIVQKAVAKREQAEFEEDFEKFKLKWAEKKKKKKCKYSSPYLEPQPINEMCWYEERAIRDLKDKVLKQMAKQEARDRYLESLKPKKAAEQEQEAEEKDKDSENWDDWLEDDEEQRHDKVVHKKLKKLTSLEELDVTLKEDDNYLISNPISDTNLYELAERTDIPTSINTNFN